MKKQKNRAGIKRYRERRRKRLLERQKRGTMNEDRKFEPAKHPRNKKGRFVLKSGAKDTTPDNSTKEESAETHQGAKQEKTNGHIPVGKLNEVKKDLDRRLVGKKTTEGKTVKSIGGHLVLRCAKREIYPSSVVETVFHGKLAKNLGKKGRSVYVYRGTMVILTPEGELMNAIYKGKKGNK